MADLSRLAEGFSFADFGRAPARFDLHELEGLNARIVHGLPWEAVADRLPAGMDRAAWEAIRPNLARVAEAADWWAVVEGSVAPPEVFGDDDRAFLLFAADEAGGIDWAGDPWGALTDALKATGRKGRALFLPLRLALTGREHGPDMRALLPLIGRERAVERLRAAAGAEAGAVA
ncbi:MAG: Glutamyl-tRNA(Gln) synthetase [uncultured Sphingomonadaceae bacterium]|uniref:Glutamyl-tRNA(Gln) synthetase n=1 Tax=uncultured Sphingomonadaceae bacterium TaxID=169976 RepID=A0A6J4SH76_9SPHN|nr:MAG: Glutamyl-tRNA(Gln) synthetase [uncultured Sphingomonadaceae bacterium]